MLTFAPQKINVIAMPENSKEKLFQEFPPISVEQWEQVILKDLKGADYEKKLIWNTLEGFKVKPYYTNQNLSHRSQVLQNEPPVRGYQCDGNNWDICEELYIANLKNCNTQAKDALAKGATAINFIVQDKIHTRLSEIIKNSDDMAVLLDGIDINTVKINFISGFNSSTLITILEEYLAKKGIKTDGSNISFDFDPIGHLTVNGNFFFPKESVFNQTASLLKYAETVVPKATFLGVNGYFFANAGATAVQELAYSLAIADDYLALLTEQGLKAEQVIKNMKFNLGIGSNYFMEIAKVRAFRWLLAQVAEQYVPGLTVNNHIHSITIDWNKTAYDPNVNMLRLTTETMSAILGGANSITVRPYDVNYRGPSDFSRRIARNTQILLKEEAYFDKVADIAGGSYYIETLTESLANEAWKLFVEISSKGGYVTNFLNGEIQKALAKTAQKRDANIATRQEILLGTNQYPNLNEKIKGEVSPCSMNPMNPSGGKELAEPIHIYRGAKAFEDLRLSVESMAHMPKVFHLTYGNLAMRKARAGFSSSFFGCAGFQVIDNFGFETPGEGIAAALETKSEIVVVCSSDDEYPLIMPEIIEALNNSCILVLAGYPKDHVENLKQMGLKHFIHVKTNLLDTLTMFRDLVKNR